MDINILLVILEDMSSTDILNYCSTEKNVHRLCIKYSDIIWSRKLLKDFGILKTEIIGNPKSFYFGLKHSIGHYYFFDVDTLFDDKRAELRKVKKISKEEADKRQDYWFYVPGIDEPKDETIIVGYFNLSNNYGSDYVTVVGKTLLYVKRELIKKVGEELWDDWTSLESEILNIPMNYDFLLRIEDDSVYDIEIYFVEAKL